MSFEQTRYNIDAVTEYHVACVLLLDTSDSMKDEPIDNLNSALKTFIESTVENDKFASKKIDLAVVEFNTTARVVHDFMPISEFVPETMTARGSTSMGAGIRLALELIEKRQNVYRETGTPKHRPWIFMITDGLPTDDYKEAASLVRERMSLGKVLFWALGVPGYLKDPLFEITDRVFELENVEFREIFEWLSDSLIKTSNSREGDKIRYRNLPENARVVPFEDTN